MFTEGNEENKERMFQSSSVRLNQSSPKLNHVVCMELDSHSTTNLFGAAWIIVESSNVVLWPDFFNQNPHPFNMSIIVELNTKD